MLISAVNNTINQQNPYANKAENLHTVDTIDKANDASNLESQKLSGALNESHDEYIPSGDKPNKASGVYRLEKDENGQQKIVFDRPVSPGKDEKIGMAEYKAIGGLPEVAPIKPKDGEDSEKKQGPVNSGEKADGLRCTVDTNKVDAEIKKLKEEKRQIEQELKSIRDDEDKRKELEQQLSQIDSELSAKDNDAYRKQHATYTYN